MTNYSDGLWHGFNGGECPVHPETVVDFMADNGNMSSMWREMAAKQIAWTTHTGCFRVIKEHKEPREFWILGDQLYANKKDAMEERRYASLNAALYFKKHPGEIIHVREVLE